MAIDLYIGNQGTGKTYQVVTVSIKEALNQGRRVLTNIRGVNPDLIIEYLKQENKDDGRTYGTIQPFRTSDVRKNPDFYPDLRDEFFQTMDDLDPSKYIVQPGDLLILDEAYEAYPKEDKFPMRDYTFFMKHRQYANVDTGLSCEVIIITQDLTKLHKDMTSTVAYTYKSIDLLELGTKDKFTIEIFKGVPKYRDKPERVLSLQTYDKTKFSWYKSHVVEGAKQVKVDTRQNIFKGWGIRFALFGTPLLIGLGIYGVVNYFNKMMHPEENKQLVTTQNQQQKATTTQNTLTPLQASQQSVLIQPQQVTPEWKITGISIVGTITTVYISDGKTQRVLINPETKIYGRYIEAKEGQTWLNNYSVPSSSSPALLPMPN